MFDLETRGFGNLVIASVVTQPWPTQIGSRAKFLLNHQIVGKNIGFFLKIYPIFLKNCDIWLA
jgi:hypothetical protein